MHPCEKRWENHVAWWTGENDEGNPIGSHAHVRLSGQDCVGGTFNQRHAAVYCNRTSLEHVPPGTNKTAKSSIGIERSPAKKLQDEHICLSNALRQLKDINENGGIPIRVMGKPVRVRVWIHVMVGDIFGNNGLLGSYSAYNAQCPYRDCSCPSQSFLDPNATCNLIRKADIDRISNLVLYKTKCPAVEENSNTGRRSLRVHSVHGLTLVG